MLICSSPGSANYTGVSLSVSFIHSQPDSSTCWHVKARGILGLTGGTFSTGNILTGRYCPTLHNFSSAEKKSYWIQRIGRFVFWWNIFTATLFIYGAAYIPRCKEDSMISELIIFCQYWKLAHQSFYLFKSTSGRVSPLTRDRKTPNYFLDTHKDVKKQILQI